MCHSRDRIRVMVFNAIFNNISVILWQSVLLVEETKVLGENHRPAASHWQTLSHNVLWSTPHLSRIRTHNIKHWLHRWLYNFELQIHFTYRYGAKGMGKCATKISEDFYLTWLCSHNWQQEKLSLLQCWFKITNEIFKIYFDIS